MEEKMRKKIKERAGDNIGLDNSDIPIHEEYAEDKKIRELKKSKNPT